MTRAQLIKSQSRAISDALALIPHGSRSQAVAAVEHAFIRGVEYSLRGLGEARDTTACSACATFINGVVKRLQIED
jgi:hypothetical protein